MEVAVNNLVVENCSLLSWGLGCASDDNKDLDPKARDSICQGHWQKDNQS